MDSGKAGDNVERGRALARRKPLGKLRRLNRRVPPVRCFEVAATRDTGRGIAHQRSSI
jgi:hypothetical protein